MVHGVRRTQCTPYNVRRSLCMSYTIHLYVHYTTYIMIYSVRRTMYTSTYTMVRSVSYIGRRRGITPWNYVITCPERLLRNGVLRNIRHRQHRHYISEFAEVT